MPYFLVSIGILLLLVSLLIVDSDIPCKGTIAFCLIKVVYLMLKGSLEMSSLELGERYCKTCVFTCCNLT